MANEPKDKLMRDSLQAGFNAGWLAAHMSLADQADEQGLAVLAEWMRERGQKPDRVDDRRRERLTGGASVNPRLYIATHALQGLLANAPDARLTDESIAAGLDLETAMAAQAVDLADALLAELAKTSPAAAASPPAADVARLGRALLHATSPCAGAGPMEMRGGEAYEPACEECKEVAEVLAELRKRQEAQRA